MAARGDRIGERLPHFYMCWDDTSVIARIIASFGRSMDEAEKDLLAVMHSHWVDKACLQCLDQIGSLYKMARAHGEEDPDYRRRLKTAILSYQGGGTIAAVQAAVRIALRLPPDYPVTIIENPPVRLEKSETLRSADERKIFINPRSIQDTIPVVTLRVVSEDSTITNPTLHDETAGISYRFNGSLKTGDVLVYRDRRVFVNGNEVSGEWIESRYPVLERKKSTWRYSEDIGANVGKFDEGHFDQSVFSIDNLTLITFEWQARETASFILQIPRDLLERAGVSQRFLQDLVNTIKAAGVKGEVNVIEGESV